MEIITDKNIDFEKWEKFVLEHPEGNFFQSVNAYRFFESVDNYNPFAFAVLEDEEILGILSGVVISTGKGLKKFLSRRAIIWGGPLLNLSDNRVEKKEEVIDLLLKSVDAFCKKHAIYVEFRNLFDFSAYKEYFNKKGFKYEDHLNILIDLTLSEDDLIKNINKYKRGNINKSKNKGVLFEEINDMQNFSDSINLIHNTYIKVKLPCPNKQFFLNAYNNLLNSKILKIFCAYHSEKMIGTRMEICYKDVIYDWYAGSDDEYKNKYPNDFLPYNIILWGKRNGYMIFDFGGAGKPNVEYGVRNHKIKFGGELVNYGRFKKIYKPCFYFIGKYGFFLLKIIHRKI